VALEASCQLVVEALVLIRLILIVQMPGKTVGDCFLDWRLTEQEVEVEARIRVPWALEVVSVPQLMAAWAPNSLMSLDPKDTASHLLFLCPLLRSSVAWACLQRTILPIAALRFPSLRRSLPHRPYCHHCCSSLCFLLEPVVRGRRVLWVIQGLEERLRSQASGGRRIPCPL